MAGYREFVTGEVLTAANVNQFLMEQATMTFADDAARTAALAGVLREGLLTYNLDTNRLEVYDGTAWVEPAPEPPAGIGSNVVQTVKTDTFTTSSASYVDVTGLTVTITPSTNTSKVLIVASVNFSPGNTGFTEAGHIQLIAGGSAVLLGNAAGSRTRASATTGQHSTTTFHVAYAQPNAALVFLHSPSTTSPVIYKIQARRGAGGTMFVNRSGNDDDRSEQARTASTITVIEVAP